MYRKNTAGQFVSVQLLLTASGAIATGLTPTVRRCIDGTFAAGGGTVTEDTGTGAYKYAMAQADTNGNNISLFFTATGAMPVCINFVTTAADPTDGVRLGLTALPNAAAGANGGLPTGDASGKVALQASQKVDVDTIKTNPVVNAGTVTFPTGATLASTTNITAGTITTVTTVTNQLTAAAIATGVWTDTTASDFTTALSVGKSLMNGVSLGTGLTVNDITTKTGYALTSAYDFAKGTVAMTESYAANGAAPTPVQAIYAIHQNLMDFAISGTSYTVKKLDTSTTAFTVTLNDATSPTGASR